MTTQHGMPRSYGVFVMHPQRWASYTLLLGVLSVLSLGGCKDLTGSQPLPAGTNSPAFYQTRAGALGMRNAAVYQLEQKAIPNLVASAALFADELESNQMGASLGVLQSSSLAAGGSLDERILPSLGIGLGGAGDNTYAVLQAARGSITQAIGALAAYDTMAESPVLRAELYALDGYTELLLADFFCSGVPLSTLDFQGDFTDSPSSTTAQVYEDALAKLDTVLVLAPDSVQLQYLTAVLKGRAFLGLGRYAEAAQMVAAVPDGFQYQLAVQWTPAGGFASNNPIRCCTTVSDREGANGLPFVSSGDPRTAVIRQGTSSTGQALYYPAKYTLTGFSPFTVASGVEARLIQAEAALRAGDDTQWLTTLNTLRVASAQPADSVTLVDTIGVTPPVYSPLGRLLSAGVDTVWNAFHTRILHIYTIDTYLHPVWPTGMGGIAGLYPIVDPVDPAARVDTMFTERAAWLFLTGARQGDLRRLIRQYGRRQDQVYPIGPYLAPGAGQYGSDVTAPIPSTEYANPLFHGCINRDA